MQNEWTPTRFAQPANRKTIVGASWLDRIQCISSFPLAMANYCQMKKQLRCTAVTCATLLAATSVLLIYDQWTAEPVDVQPMSAGSSLLALISLENTNDSVNGCFYNFEIILQAYVSSYRRCLLENLDKKSVWSGIQGAIFACLGGSLSQLLHIRKLKGKDDIKHVILPGPRAAFRDDSTFDCVHVTLGVGDNIDAEIQLFRLLPRCRFYGAGPTRKSGQIFKRIGKHYKLAVASSPGTLEASVVINGKHQMKNVTAVSLNDFLINYAKVDHVDFMFMDVEGAEYGILQGFIGGGNEGEDNVTICQISVEMHGSAHKMKNQFDQLITGMIKSSSYLPVWFEGQNYRSRSYYVNFKDKYCVKTYFTDRFCLNEKAE